MSKEFIYQMIENPESVWFGFGWKIKETIVRCRDCNHYDKNDAGCMRFVVTSNKLLHLNYPDGFCAWGERREL